MFIKSYLSKPSKMCWHCPETYDSITTDLWLGALESASAEIKRYRIQIIIDHVQLHEDAMQKAVQCKIWLKNYVF